MVTTTYNGVEITYDERCFHSYKLTKAFMSGDERRVSWALERIFCGRDEEYADALCGNEDPEALDSSLEVMMDLVAHLKEGDRPAKN